MKKALIVCAVVLLLLGSCLAFGGHEQRMFQYVQAPVQEATLEDLLSAAYATEGTWEILEIFSMYHNGAGMEAEGADPEKHKVWIEELLDLMQDQTFVCVQKESKLRSYDKQMDKIFERKTWEYPVYIQLRCVSSPMNAPQAGDTEVTGVRLYCLEDLCYLTVSYQTEPEPNTTAYAFASSDPELMEKLETFVFERTQN